MDPMLRHLATATLLCLCLGACPKPGYLPRDGDVVFQTSRSRQSLAIQLATHSRYSHMGIVYLRHGRPFVFEAVGPVRLTPLRAWIARGVGHHFVVKRLRHAGSVLTPKVLARMKQAGEKLLGRRYDLAFGWSDTRVYCSELVWKVYQRGAGIPPVPHPAPEGLRPRGPAGGEEAPAALREAPASGGDGGVTGGHLRVEEAGDRVPPLDATGRPRGARPASSYRRQSGARYRIRTCDLWCDGPGYWIHGGSAGRSQCGSAKLSHAGSARRSRRGSAKRIHPGSAGRSHQT